MASSRLPRLVALLGIPLVLSSCGLLGGTPPPPASPTKAPVPTPTATEVGDKGTSSCTLVPLESESIRTPMVIISGDAEVFDQSSRITVKLSAPLAKEAFQGGVGDGVIRDYGFKVYGAGGKLLVYSFKSDLAQIYEADGKPSKTPANLNFAFTRDQVELTFPTEPLGMKASNWAVELYAAEADRVRKSSCAFGSEGEKAIREAEILKPTKKR